MTSIFLSHNHKDKNFVNRLAIDLNKFGVNVWVDEAEIKIGDSLIEKIGQGIKEMEYLGVVLSQNSINSEWVRKEVDIALNQEIEGKRVWVLPLLLQECEIPIFLKGRLCADFRKEEEYQNAFRKLLEKLGIPNDRELNLDQYVKAGITPSLITKKTQIPKNKLHFRCQIPIYIFEAQILNCFNINRDEIIEIEYEIHPEDKWRDEDDYRHTYFAYIKRKNGMINEVNLWELVENWSELKINSKVPEGYTLNAIEIISPKGKIFIEYYYPSF